MPPAEPVASYLIECLAPHVCDKVLSGRTMTASEVRSVYRRLSSKVRAGIVIRITSKAE